jgi:two-component system chemotaxis response regulator CheB
VLDDGSAGLLTVKLAGGATVVQEPQDALYPAMPMNAIEHVQPEHVLPVAQMPELISRLASSPPEAKRARLAPIEPMSGGDGSTQPRPGEPSGFTCPDCGGALWEDRNGLLRYRCRVGHEYAVESLLSSQGEAVESALWASLRALEERAALYRRLAERTRNARPTQPSQFERRAEEADSHAGVLRAILENLEAPLELEGNRPTGAAEA